MYRFRNKYWVSQEYGDSVTSAVIVKTGLGYSVTLRFINNKYDRILSSYNKNTLYDSVDRYVRKVNRARK